MNVITVYTTHRKTECNNETIWDEESLVLTSIFDYPKGHGAKHSGIQKSIELSTGMHATNYVLHLSGMELLLDENMHLLQLETRINKVKRGQSRLPGASGHRGGNKRRGKSNIA